MEYILIGLISSFGFLLGLYIKFLKNNDKIEKMETQIKTIEIVIEKIPLMSQQLIHIEKENEKRESKINLIESEIKEISKTLSSVESKIDYLSDYILSLKK